MSGLGWELAIAGAWLVGMRLAHDLLGGAVRRGWLSAFAARKAFHVLVGIWVIPLAHGLTRAWLFLPAVALILAGNAGANWRRHRTAIRLDRGIFYLVTVVWPLLALGWAWLDGRRAELVLAVLAMSAGDAAAAIAGRRLGGPRLPWTGKSLAGAAGNALAVLGIVTVGGHFGYGWALPALLPAAAAAALAGAAVEAALPGWFDNPAMLVTVLLVLAAML
jgi:dolichol kinase